MNKELQNIVTDKYVLNHLFSLGTKLKNEFYKCKNLFSEEVLEAMKDSPATTQWIKDILLPGIYNGDEGVNEILNNIEKENNIFLSANKMQILIKTLNELEEPLFKIKEAQDEGEYSLEENLILYEENKRPFKIFH